MEAPTLRRCVGDAGAFFARYWGRAPLLVPAAGDHGFDDLASLDDLDRMISSLALRASSLRMVKDGETVAPSAYTVAPGDRSRGTEALVNPALVYERFFDGATIVLEGIHRLSEPLAAFCRGLELDLGHRLQINAYITPVGSQGFDVHRDDHDVFVMQLWGAKRWSVFDRSEDDVAVIEQDIKKGDCLYIPDGFPHAAQTTDEISAHLTVGILTNDSIDVVREITKLAAEEPAFTERLERIAVGDERALRAEVERHVDELRNWLDKVDPDEITRRVARRLWTTSQPMLRGQLGRLAALDEITADTGIRKRPGVTAYLSRRADVVRLLLADRELELPAFAHDAVAYIVDRDAPRVDELHAFLDPDSALVLVRRLMREGLLEVVD